eukprot:CAMPEP_0168537262 /NCGR_PEP_ID=MMETSP0405-20121227/20196_1 /TAXON_ID=498012 /ORGANISM="Trichosphaerium sp, Strain Am-I-7 wt" /LENGTH=171 /DNA_ID=CAMNT_0008565737 /DNA_START=16 /DNA_END=531 /DNA_ORIENTATION=+
MGLFFGKKKKKKGKSDGLVKDKDADDTKAGDYDYFFRLILLGNSGGGKSSILRRFTDEIFEDNYSTVGVDFKQKIVKSNDTPIKLQIWDTAGQEKFRTITNSYYNKAEGVVLVFDVCSQESFDGLGEWLVEVEKYAAADIPILLLGNKNDKEGRVITESVAQEWAVNGSLK